MLHQMTQKTVCFEGCAAAGVASDATSVANIDTLNFDKAHIIYATVVATNTSAATKLTSFTVSHGTTTDVSNHTTIAGLQGTTNATATSDQFVLPAGNATGEGQVTQCFVNLVGKERILQIIKECPASYSNVSGICLLSGTADVPDTAQEMSRTDAANTATIGYG